MYIFVIWERKALNWTCIILYIHQKESFKCKTLNWTSIYIHQKEIIQHGWRTFCWTSKLWRIKRAAFWSIFDKKLNFACCKFWIRCNLVWWIRCGCTCKIYKMAAFPIDFDLFTPAHSIHNSHHHVWRTLCRKIIVYTDNVLLIMISRLMY